MEFKTKVKNAIILAAGYSSRFVPICFDLPKGLLPIKGETMIERQIRQLKEVGINEVHIVTGAYAQQFEFLKKKHNVNLIYNKDYSTKNNFASLYAAREVLSDSIISSSDLFFPRNIFQNSAEHSYYASVFINGKTSQRSLQLDKNGKIIATSYGGKNTWITFGGQAFFTKDISKKIIAYIDEVYDNPLFANKYWVDFQDAHLEELPMYIKKVNINDIVEFNTLDVLKRYDINFTCLEISNTMKFICKELNANENELTNFLAIKQGNASIGCEFMFKGNKYCYFTKENQIKTYKKEYV